MLRRLLKLKAIANELTTSESIVSLTDKQKDKLSKLQLIDLKWSNIEELAKLLFPFYECTKMLSGSNYCTLSNAFVVKKILIDFIENSDDSDSAFLKSLKEQLNII